MRNRRLYLYGVGVVGWLLILLATPQPVSGAGFYAPGIGTRGMGRGATNTATGRDLTSHWYNPANLSRLRGFHFAFDGTLLFNPFSFERAQIAGNKPFPKVVNLAGPNFIPFLGLSWDFGYHLKVPRNHSIVLSVAVWGPNGGNYYYNEDSYDPNKIGEAGAAQPECQGPNKDNFICRSQGPQRYSVIRSKPFQVFGSAALAYGVLLGPVGIRVGAGFQLVQTRVEQTLALKALSESTDLDNFDAIISLNTVSPFTPSGNFGLTIDLPAGFSIGAAFKLPIHVVAKGTLKVNKLPEALGGTVEVTGDAAQLELNLPWIFRAGLAWRPTFLPRLEVEFNFVYEAWSSLDVIKLTSPAGPNQFKTKILGTEEPLEPIDIERRWRDAWSLRFGAQFAILPKYLFIRAGYYYETSAIPNEHFNLSELNGERHGITAGIEGRIPLGPTQLILAFAYSHTFETPLNITNSQERNIILKPIPETAQGEVVANGAYRAQLDLISFSLSFMWGGYDQYPTAR